MSGIPTVTWTPSTVAIRSEGNTKRGKVPAGGYVALFGLPGATATASVS